MRADHSLALVAETTTVLWDDGTGASWRQSDEARADMRCYAGPPVSLRERPAR